MTESKTNQEPQTSTNTLLATVSDSESYSIENFISDLNTCLSKFKESTNGDLYPVISWRWDIKQMNDVGGLSLKQEDFIQLSNGQVLGIKDFTKSPQLFLNLSHYQDKIAVNC